MSCQLLLGIGALSIQRTTLVPRLIMRDCWSALLLSLKEAWKAV